jgi:hypothetical protein
MQSRWLIPGILMILALLLASGCFSSNTNHKTASSIIPESPPIKYLKYELPANDRFFKDGLYQFSLFSIEYPDTFVFADTDGGDTYSAVYFMLNFMRRQIDMQECWLSVLVLPRGFAEREDAEAVYDSWLTQANRRTPDVKSGVKTVAGIDSKYMSYSYFRIDNSFYAPGYESFRGVVFDHQNLVWTIVLNWFYNDTEIPEVDQYFEHAIQTFKFIN